MAVAVSFADFVVLIVSCDMLQIPVTSGKRDFVREAEIMKTLKHPNIVGCFGSAFIGNDFNILIEWMPGELVYILANI